MPSTIWDIDRLLLLIYYLDPSPEVLHLKTILVVQAWYLLLLIQIHCITHNIKMIGANCPYQAFKMPHPAYSQ